MKRPFLLIVLALSLFLLFVVGTLGAEAQEEYPDADAEALLNYILNEEPYTEWSFWPQEELEGFLDSGTPHGGVVRIFVNEVALSVAEAFPGEMPAHSIIVKENFTGEAPSEPGDLDALTVMYKVPGFNPDAGNWYWLKSSPDGSTVDAAGVVEGCIGCHGGVEGHKDYILRYGFDGQPAVANAEQLQAGQGTGSSESAAGEEAAPSPETLPETGTTLHSNAYTIAFFFLAGLLLVGLARLFRRAGLA